MCARAGNEEGCRQGTATRRDAAAESHFKPIQRRDTWKVTCSYTSRAKWCLEVVSTHYYYYFCQCRWKKNFLWRYFHSSVPETRCSQAWEHLRLGRKLEKSRRGLEDLELPSHLSAWRTSPGSFFGAAWWDLRCLCVPLARCRMHPAYSDASGSQCKVRLWDSPLWRSQLEGLASCSLCWALNKAGCYFPDYLVRLTAGLRSLYVAEALQRDRTSAVWRLHSSSWWFTADHLIFRALFINKLCSIYLVFPGIYESKVQSAPKTIDSSNPSFLCIIG